MRGIHVKHKVNVTHNIKIIVHHFACTFFVLRMECTKDFMRSYIKIYYLFYNRVHLRGRRWDEGDDVLHNLAGHS